MTTSRRGRIPLRETMAQNQKALAIYAMLADKPRYEIAMPPAPVKRAPAVPSGIPLEKDVLRDIVAALKQRPEVVFVGRFNSGTSVETDQFGNHRYTRFNTVHGFTDIHGMLRGGRAFYIEVKRPQRASPVTEEQQDFIDHVRGGGGLAGVATSVQEAFDILGFDFFCPPL